MKAEKKEEKIKEKKNIKSENNKEEFVPYMAIKTEPGAAENRDKVPKPDPRYSIKYANTLPVIDTMRQETKKEEQATWGNLFEDASIKSLPNDLLLMIFGYCKDTETLYTLPQVCRHWRRLTLEPSLVRLIKYKEKHHSCLSFSFILYSGEVYHINGLILSSNCESCVKTRKYSQ